MATCSVCRRHRKIYRSSSSGRPFCYDCGKDEPATHECPDCGVSVHGGGVARCKACEARGRAWKRIRLDLELLEQPWVRSRFEEFCVWAFPGPIRGNPATRIDRYAIFFADIDRHFSSPGEVCQTKLFELMGAERLRRCFMAVDFLSQRLPMTWSGSLLQQLVVQRRTLDACRKWQNQPWSTDIADYYRHLSGQSRPRLSPRTVRSYIQAAGRLFQLGGAASLRHVTQEHLHALLRRAPGLRASLAAFVRYAAGMDVRLALPKRAGRSQRTREAALVARIRKVLTALEHASDPRSIRALLADAVSRLYQVPIEQVLSLTMLEVGVDAGVVTLWPSTLRVCLNPIMSEALIRCMTGLPGPLVFPGRNGQQALSYHAVRHHTKQALESA